MQLYKLTDNSRCTRGEMLWTKGRTNRVNVDGAKLCSKQVLHAYTSPEEAIFFDPIHGGYTNHSFRMCVVEGDVVADDGTKVGCKEQTVVRWLKPNEIPVITVEQRVEIAIRCVKAVYKDKAWNVWADNWLSGKDRSAAARAACAAARDACSAARAAFTACAAADAAAYVADRAVCAAYAGTDAAATAVYVADRVGCDVRSIIRDVLKREVE